MLRAALVVLMSVRFYFYVACLLSTAVFHTLPCPYRTRTVVRDGLIPVLRMVRWGLQPAERSETEPPGKKPLNATGDGTTGLLAKPVGE